MGLISVFIDGAPQDLIAKAIELYPIRGQDHIRYTSYPPCGLLWPFLVFLVI